MKVLSSLQISDLFMLACNSDHASVTMTWKTDNAWSVFQKGDCMWWPDFITDSMFSCANQLMDF